MTAFVLTDPQGQVKDREQLDLYDGYLALGLPTQFFRETDFYIGKVPITNKDVFGGHVNICRQIWKNFKIKEPDVPDYPEVLEHYFGRKIWKCQLWQFYNLLKENENFGKTYFVKPVKNKIFTGYTCVTVQDLNQIGHVSYSTNVYVSTYVKFDAEYRAYVYKNKIVDVFRYWGDNWQTVIDRVTVEKMVSLLSDMPVFYSLDFAVDNLGRTLLVEINDGYALGNYGLAPVDYAKMTMDRFQEIVL